MSSRDKFGRYIAAFNNSLLDRPQFKKSITGCVTSFCVKRKPLATCTLCLQHETIYEGCGHSGFTKNKSQITCPTTKKSKLLPRQSCKTVPVRFHVSKNRDIPTVSAFSRLPSLAEIFVPLYAFVALTARHIQLLSPVEQTGMVLISNNVELNAYVLLWDKTQPNINVTDFTKP
ncbi:hypothetical protein GJ496_002568 [Pomphorhynchus laevis]|nr:hypothetical protein GJ496_011278 [Pomphorhynchus laevis]KAI0983438.1 hypothetical protein GJ496_007152 [Pomphorhynchus laevis]KAI0988069.1 hypothetical protein GJ496_002568 [Pomphorhynchus laevis]